MRISFNKIEKKKWFRKTTAWLACGRTCGHLSYSEFSRNECEKIKEFLSNIEGASLRTIFYEGDMVMDAYAIEIYFKNLEDEASFMLFVSGGIDI